MNGERNRVYFSLNGRSGVENLRGAEERAAACLGNVGTITAEFSFNDSV